VPNGENPDGIPEHLVEKPVGRNDDLAAFKVWELWNVAARIWKTDQAGQGRLYLGPELLGS
jgi:hypothetical protein